MNNLNWTQKWCLLLKKNRYRPYSGAKSAPWNYCSTRPVSDPFARHVSHLYHRWRPRMNPRRPQRWFSCFYRTCTRYRSSRTPSPSPVTFLLAEFYYGDMRSLKFWRLSRKKRHSWCFLRRMTPMTDVNKKNVTKSQSADRANFRRKNMTTSPYDQMTAKLLYFFKNNEYE